MRVFVLGTGRTGSTTFVKACRHIDNYTASTRSLPETDIRSKRLDYPECHIEVDPRLVTALDALGASFASTALFVHLRGDEVSGAEIDAFLATVPYSMTIDLETAKSQFSEFWSRIGADGDLSAAIAEFDRRYDAGRAGIVGRAR